MTKLAGGIHWHQQLNLSVLWDLSRNGDRGRFTSEIIFLLV